jgi:hypothetical protein
MADRFAPPFVVSSKTMTTGIEVKACAKVFVTVLAAQVSFPATSVLDAGWDTWILESNRRTSFNAPLFVRKRSDFPFVSLDKKGPVASMPNRPVSDELLEVTLSCGAEPTSTCWPLELSVQASVPTPEGGEANPK